jgi:HEAT repeat protein
MHEDAGSLETILSELTNRDPEIRGGALEAAIQFGSREAIPRLMDAANQTDDPKEKAALDEAVEFLKLPSLKEVLAQNRK